MDYFSILLSELQCRVWIDIFLFICYFELDKVDVMIYTFIKLRYTKESYKICVIFLRS